MAVSGCGPRNMVQPTIISGTIKPVALIAQAIAGSALQVQVLAGDDGAPLQNARELVSTSAVVFQTGTSIDTWFSEMEQGRVRFVSLSAALDKGTPDGSWLSFRDSADMARLMRDTLDALSDARYVGCPVPGAEGAVRLAICSVHGPVQPGGWSSETAGLERWYQGVPDRGCNVVKRSQGFRVASCGSAGAEGS